MCEIMLHKTPAQKKKANGLKEHANSLYDCRWRFWPQFSVPLVTAVNKATLRCAYEHRGKRSKVLDLNAI